MEIAAISPSHGLGGRARAFDWFDQRRAGRVASRLDRVLPRRTFRRISKKFCAAAKRITMMGSFSCRFPAGGHPFRHAEAMWRGEFRRWGGLTLLGPRLPEVIAGPSWAWVEPTPRSRRHRR